MNESLEGADRYWVLHETVIVRSLIRCYNHDVTPAEALALLNENSTVDEVTDTEED